jgi:hypothetical protein
VIAFPAAAAGRGGATAIPGGATVIAFPADANGSIAAPAQIPARTFDGIGGRREFDKVGGKTTFDAKYATTRTFAGRGRSSF